MVVMMFPGIVFVPVGTIAEIAPAQDADLLQSREAAVHGHQIAHAGNHPFVHFFCGVRAVIRSEKPEDGLPRLRDALIVRFQELNRGLKRLVTVGMIAGHLVSRITGSPCLPLLFFGELGSAAAPLPIPKEEDFQIRKLR
jgi:hypothetical protein